MAATTNISVQEYAAFLQRGVEYTEKQAVNALKSVGEECVAEAYEAGNYSDRTGCLRSSIGYGVCKDGKIVAEGGFRLVGNGTDGQNEGRALLQELAMQSDGLCLFLVAGMKYARYVADKGFNVTDSAEILAKRLLSQLESGR